MTTRSYMPPAHPYSLKAALLGTALILVHAPSILLTGDKLSLRDLSSWIAVDVFLTTCVFFHYILKVHILRTLDLPTNYRTEATLKLLLRSLLERASIWFSYFMFNKVDVASFIEAVDPEIRKFINSQCMGLSLGVCIAFVRFLNTATPDTRSFFLQLCHSTGGTLYTTSLLFGTPQRIYWALEDFARFPDRARKVLNFYLSSDPEAVQPILYKVVCLSTESSFNCLFRNTVLASLSILAPLVNLYALACFLVRRSPWCLEKHEILTERGSPQRSQDLAQGAELDRQTEQQPQQIRVVGVPVVQTQPILHITLPQPSH